MTAAQTHRIARQTIELLGCRQADAAALQAAVARHFESGWMPVLERVCSALGDPGRVLHIDRLEIDLGAVTVQALQSPGGTADPADGPAAAEPSLLQRLEAALREGLARALPGAASVSADQDLLAFFLHSGALPWWADSSDRGAVARSIAALEEAPPAQWQALLAGADGAPSPEALRRLVVEAGAPRLARLLARWRAAAGGPTDAGWHVALQPAWQATLDRLAARLSQPAHRLHDAWWQAALATALADPRALARDFWQASVQRVAVALALQPAPLRQALRQSLDHADAAADWPAPLWQARADDPVAAEPPRGAPDALLDAALARLAAPGSPEAERWRRWRAAWPAAWARLAADQRQRLADALRGGQPEALRDALADLLATPDATEALSAPTPGDHRRLAADWTRAVQGARTAPVAAPGRSTGPQAESVQVPNAGLVLLWPFVTRFMQRLDLLQPGPPQRFRDDEAAARAARLLHLAVSGDAEAPEHQLPLAKLLCGLPLEAPLPPLPPFTAAEAAEADALVQALLAQASGLGQLSVAGFRASFGLRAGQLSARDGHWLLRVERQAYDLLLGRLPWGFAIVRLPWMPRLLQVEW